MNKHKKITILVCAFLTVLSIVACGQAKEDEFAANEQEGGIQPIEDTDPEIKGDEIVNVEEPSVNQQESNMQTVENIDLETRGDETANVKEPSVNQQGNSAQAVENADPEMTAEELLDLFIDGSISAVDSTDLTSAFYITDLNMDSEEGDSYSIGEKIDLDNDGEDELVISGPYGGIYFDARNGKVYEFAAGDGSALILSYTYYNGAVWIMYSNRMNAGYESYHMQKFEGADNLVAEIDFSEELVDPNNADSETKYTLNGTTVSYDEYTELCSKIFAAEVNTN